MADSGPSGGKLKMGLATTGSPIAGMTAQALSEAIDSLQEVYRNANHLDIRNTIIAANGDRDDASVYLYAEPPALNEGVHNDLGSSQDSSEERFRKYAADEDEIDKIGNLETKRKVRELLNIFPRHSASQVLSVLEESLYNPAEAAYELTNISPSSALDSSAEHNPNVKGREVNASNKIAARSQSPWIKPGSPSSSNLTSDSDTRSRETPRTTASTSPPSGSALPLRLAATSPFDDLFGGAKTPKVKHEDYMSDDSPTPKIKTERNNTGNGESIGKDIIFLDSNEEDVHMLLGGGRTKKGVSLDPALESDDEAKVDVDQMLVDISDSDQESVGTSDEMMVDEVEGASEVGKGMDVVAKKPEIDEEEINSQTEEEKIQELFSIFPRAGEHECANELQLAQGDMQEAFNALEDQWGYLLLNDDDKDEASKALSSDASSIDLIAPRKPKILKRRAEVPKEGRKKKKARRANVDTDEEEEAAGLEPASQWVRDTINANDGFQIVFDSGSHPCMISEKVLRKIPGFKSQLDAEEIAAKRTLTVPNVSQATFDLALQYAVCQQIRPEARSKSDEITAFINLSIFASQAGLRLTHSNSSFMINLKALLTDPSEPLKGKHIRSAFENLDEGHRIRQLFIHASLKPYAEFYHSGQDVRRSYDESDSENSEKLDKTLNPAQRAFYQSRKFRFHSEFDNLKDYRYALLEEFHSTWWSRTVIDKKHGKLKYDETELVDPLTSKPFKV